MPNPKGGWDVKKGGGKKASHHFDIKAEAEKRARELSKKYRAELVIHDKHVKIRQSDSHGHDPNPLKDRETH